MSFFSAVYILLGLLYDFILNLFCEIWYFIKENLAVFVVAYKTKCTLNVYVHGLNNTTFIVGNHLNIMSRLLFCICIMIIILGRTTLLLSVKISFYVFELGHIKEEFFCVVFQKVLWSKVYFPVKSARQRVKYFINHLTTDIVCILFFDS